MTKPLHSLSPQELADQGIPVEVALRARIEKAEAAARDERTLMIEWFADCASLRAYQDALAIIEAQR